MRKIIVLLLILIFAIGCATEEIEDSEETDSGSQATEPKAAAKEEVPTEGKIEFSSQSKTSLVVIDSPLDLDLAIKGNIDYEIDKTIVTGKGSGSFSIDLLSDIGLAKCTAKKTIPITYDITGTYNKVSNEISYKSSNIKPANSAVTLDCPSEDYGDISYELELPVQSFIGTGEEFVLKHEDQSLKEVAVMHPIAGWDLSIESKWQFKTELQFSEFDFDVDVDPAIVSIIQGATATPLVTVKLVKGKAQDVVLTVTNWPKLKAFIVNPTTTPTETTTLTIETTCDTPVDNYLYTVQGETAGTFKTSVDSVSIQVAKNNSC